MDLKKLNLFIFTFIAALVSSSTLDKIKGIGIIDMEFSSLFGKTADELRKLLDDRGIKCSSFGVSYSDLIN